MKYRAQVRAHFPDFYRILNQTILLWGAFCIIAKIVEVMFSKKVNSLNDLDRIAKECIEAFPNKRIFAIYAKMGAGKTTFIQSLCRALGSTDNVTSPTFALINEYNSSASGSVFHFDFYRIEEIEEAYDMGYEDYIYSGNYCFIEWPEMIAPLLPENIVEITIKVLENDQRLITAQIV